MSADLEKRITDLERQLKAIGQNYVQLKRTRTEGHQPGIDQINTNTMVYNEADGLWYSKKRLPDGTESIVLIGGGSPPGTSDPHLRAHQIDSADDHPPVAEEKRGMIVATNEETGAIELIEKTSVGVQVDLKVRSSNIKVLAGQYYNRFAVYDSRNLSSSSDWALLSVSDVEGIIASNHPAYISMRENDASGEYWWPAEGANSTGFNAKWMRDDFGIVRWQVPHGGFFTWLAGDNLFYIHDSETGIQDAPNYYFMPVRFRKTSTKLKIGEHGRYLGNDGKIYDTVGIATYDGRCIEVMCENLCESKYRNGDLIMRTVDNGEPLIPNTGYTNDYQVESFEIVTQEFNLSPQNVIELYTNNGTTLKNEGEVKSFKLSGDKEIKEKEWPWFRDITPYHPMDLNAVDRVTEGFVIKSIFSYQATYLGVVGDAVCLSMENNTYINVAKADDITRMPAIGIIVDNRDIDPYWTSQFYVCIKGFTINRDWNWERGKPVYVSNAGTNGNTLTQVKPTGAGEFVQIIGYAYNSVTIYVSPSIEAVSTDFSGDKTFLFNQNTPATIWSITHDLSKFPAVTIVDTSGNEIEGDVQHIDNNALTLTFAAPFAGVATLN